MVDLRVFKYSLVFSNILVDRVSGYVVEIRRLVKLEERQLK